MHIAATEVTTSPILNDGDVLAVTVGIGIIALLVVLLPVLLARTYRKASADHAAAPGATRPAANFFEIPFITWFIVHYGIASLAILAIVLLGVDNVIDKGTVSALLGSLFGYVLGSASKGSQGTSAQPKATTPAPTPPDVAPTPTPGEAAASDQVPTAGGSTPTLEG